MCVFCAVATQTSGPTETFEMASLAENMGSSFGICVWLFVLYEGYQRTKKEIHSSNKAFLD